MAGAFSVSRDAFIVSLPRARIKGMVTKKRSARISLGSAPNQTNNARVNSHVVGGVTQVTIHGPGGPFTPYTVVKGSKHQLRPAATIVGVAPQSEQFVGFDGAQYLLKPTLAAVLADDLEPVGKVSVLSAGRVPSIESSGQSDVERLADRQFIKSPRHSREFRVAPLLRKKGLTINDWAVQAGVDFHTANRYLKGLSNPYQSTRKKLAGALGITIEDLPS